MSLPASPAPQPSTTATPSRIRSVVPGQARNARRGSGRRVHGLAARGSGAWGLVTRAVVVVALAAVVVPLEQPNSWSVPVTLSETIDGLEVAEDVTGDAGWGAVADDGTITTAEAAPEDLPAAQRSQVIETPIAFSAVGFTAPEGTSSIVVRTSEDGEAWSDPEVVEFMDAADGPDAGSAEEEAADVAAAGEQHTEPLWVGEASYLEVEVAGASPEDLEVSVIDSMHLNDGPVEQVDDPDGASFGASADASELDVVSRARWGADESLGSSTRTASQVHMGVVHHTAHASGSRANSYTREEAPGLVRAMHRYHTQSLGWADIGYNVLVDRFGTVYEGRKGGFNNGVIGAHAAGYNTGSFGVAVIGNFYDVQASPAAIDSLTEVIAVKSAIHGIDPGATTTRMGDGTPRPTIVGHRDVGQTACPGLISGLLPQIREDARETAVRFPDVEATSPHRGSILSLADAGVTNGCTTNLFCPDETLTRAQAASFIVRAFDLPSTGRASFSDVRTGGTHTGAISSLADQGWMEGYPDGSFRPQSELTRGQLATLLARGLPGGGISSDDDSDDGSRTLADLLGDGSSTGSTSTAPYPDVPEGSTHYDGIMALAEQDVRGNCGSGNFCPHDDVKRDSTATFVNEVRKLHGLY